MMGQICSSDGGEEMRVCFSEETWKTEEELHNNIKVEGW
jgi:hypothetical protein